MINRLLKTWRKHIPAMSCESGCRECCEGYAPSMTLEEWREIKHPRKIVAEIGVLPACPFLSEKGCEIYARRPMICRIFGTVSRAELEAKGVAVTLPVFCPRGRQPETPLRAGAALGLQVQYQRYLNQELKAVAAAFRQWRSIGKDLDARPVKFEWLYYLLCTRDGQHNFQQLNGTAAATLSPEDLGRLEAAIGE